MHALDALGAAEVRRAGEAVAEIRIEKLLDLLLDLVAQLEAVRAEELDAVVLVGVVRGRDHDAEIGAHGARQHGDRRRRHRAEQQHVHADRSEAGDERGLDHVARQTRILADHHPVAVIAALEQEPGRLADLERELGRDHAVGAAANAVRPEILAHVLYLRIPIGVIALVCLVKANLGLTGQGVTVPKAFTSH